MLSILNEIDKGNIPHAKNYLMKHGEFREVVLMLKNKGYLSNVIVTFDSVLLKGAKLSEKRLILLTEHSDQLKDLPTNAKELPVWVRNG